MMQTLTTVTHVKSEVDDVKTSNDPFHVSKYFRGSVRSRQAQYFYGYEHFLVGDRWESRFVVNVDATANSKPEFSDFGL